MITPIPIMVINGPNLNLLGVREPEVYGRTTLAEIEQLCHTVAGELGLAVEFHQSNHEGVIIDLVQEARESCRGIVINPAGFTSTSIAILDALLAAELPVVEVHLTNILKREQWRQHSYVSFAADVAIVGAGPFGYDFALRNLAAVIAWQTP